jgi:hypothetical protein
MHAASLHLGSPHTLGPRGPLAPVSRLATSQAHTTQGSPRFRTMHLVYPRRPSFRPWRAVYEVRASFLRCCSDYALSPDKPTQADHPEQHLCGRRCAAPQQHAGEHSRRRGTPSLPCTPHRRSHGATTDAWRPPPQPCQLCAPTAAEARYDCSALELLVLSMLQTVLLLPP